VEKERIIRTTLTVSSSGRISIASDFTVLLIEHNIKIPSVVSQKIAEEIDVHVEMQLKPRK
jgi:glycine cleavage system regulatory protein